MARLVGEDQAYRLPFLRAWANSPARWTKIEVVFSALDRACRGIAAPTRWSALAVLASVLTCAKFEEQNATGTLAMHSCSWMPNRTLRLQRSSER
eukprot:s1025_g8.t1